MEFQVEVQLRTKTKGRSSMCTYSVLQSHSVCIEWKAISQWQQNGRMFLADFRHECEMYFWKPSNLMEYDQNLFSFWLWAKRNCIWFIITGKMSTQSISRRGDAIGGHCFPNWLEKLHQAYSYPRSWRVSRKWRGCPILRTTPLLNSLKHLTAPWHREA